MRKEMNELVRLIPKEYEKISEGNVEQWFDKKGKLKFQFQNGKLEKFTIIPPIKKGDKELLRVIKARESSGNITEYFYDQKGFLTYEQDNFGRKLLVSNGYETLERNSNGIVKRTIREEKRGSRI